MGKAYKELTPVQLNRLALPGFYRVGGVSALYLKVAPGGSKSWILRATVGVKRRDIGLGGYPDVTLQMARENARTHRDDIRKGIDPVVQRKAVKKALIKKQSKQLSFIEAAKRCHKAKSSEFRNAKHRNDWLSTLENHAYSKIGGMQVDEIELHHVLLVLEPIWHTITETATRVRQRMEAVLTWATVSKYRSGDNPARWEGNLKEVLANPSKIKKVIHHPALPWQEVPQFMSELSSREGISARALEFLIYTVARSGEVRYMEWPEVDLDEKIWEVPAEKIKGNKIHRVPLSEPALKILKALPRLADNLLVFPSPRKGEVLSDMSLLQVVRRMEVDAVPHGFRSSFKDWARSCTAFQDEVSELALAHVNSDATRAAYARDELLPQRVKMMRAWAKYCDTH
jgi:integrase